MNAFSLRLFLCTLLSLMIFSPNVSAQLDSVFGDETSGDSLAGENLDSLAADAANDPQAAFDAAMKAGQELLAQEQWAEALAEFQTAAQIGGNFAAPYVGLGKCYVGLDATQDALTQFTRAMTVFGATTEPEALFEAHMERGKIYLTIPSQYNTAVEDFATAAQLDPKSAEAQYFFGRSQLLQTISSIGRGLDQTGQATLRASLEMFAKAIELNPNYGEAYLDRGRTLLRLRLIELAVADHEKAVQLMAGNTKILADLAFAYRSRAQLESGKPDADSNKMIADYNAALKAMDSYLAAHGNTPRLKPWDKPEPLEIQMQSVLISKAETLIDLGNEQNREKSHYQSAIRVADRYLALAELPSDEQAQGHYMRGRSLRMLGNLDQAIDEFGEAIALSRQAGQPNPEAAFRRGILYFRQGDYDRALADFENALLNPTSFQADSRVLLWKGLAKAKQGKPNEAIRNYSLAIRNYSEYRYAYLNRGLAYLETGNEEKALKDFNALLRIDRTDKKAAHYRKITRERLAEKSL